MKKENLKYLFIILAMFALVGGGFAVYYYGFKDKAESKEEKDKEKDKEPQKEITEDEKAFKEDYESLNGKENKNGVLYKEVKIPEDNNVVIIDDKEAVDIMKNETAIIYMGFNICPWCRNLVPILLDAASNVGIDKVYYLDILNVRSTITLNAKNKPEIKKGTDAYYDLLKILDDYLEDYYLPTDSGKKVKTGEKRIMAPTTVVVKDGVIVGVHVGTVEGHDKIDGILPDITEDQTKELYGILEKMFSKISDSACTGEC